MLGCSNVRITGEFPIFEVTFNVALWGSHEAGGLDKRFAGWRISLCHWLLLVFQRGGLVRRFRESNFYDCCMEEAYEGGLNVIFKYGPGGRLQELRGVEIVCVWVNILKLYALFLAASLGGLKIGMESSATKNTPSQINEALCVPFILP